MEVGRLGSCELDSWVDLGPFASGAFILQVHMQRCSGIKSKAIAISGGNCQDALNFEVEDQHVNGHVRVWRKHSSPQPLVLEKDVRTPKRTYLKGKNQAQTQIFADLG